MIEAVQGFNGQLERLAEMVLVLVTGAMLSYTYLPDRAIWFVLLLFFVARPVSVWLGLLGSSGVSRDQRFLISWFGIRGIGSIYYLMFALHHGLSGPLADQAIALTLSIVAAACIGTVLAQGLRPEVGKPLQQAGELLKAGKSREALAKVREAEAVPNRTANEQLTIDRMKAAAAQRAGDQGTAIQALESLHGKVGAGEQGQIAEQIASAYAQQRNNAKATEWMNKAIAAGNNSATIKQLQSYLLSTGGDHAAIAKDAAAAVSAAEQAGRKPDDCTRELQTACKGLALGKFCGMRHAH
jgi:phosphotransferase system  glucose/maltose/N-acetylglucosamine-specific IIC component